MKKQFVIASFLLGLIGFGQSLYAQCADSSAVYSFTYLSKNYEIVKEMKTWVNAAACAVERGGYLVEINDANEQAAVRYAIQNSGVSNTYTSISNGGGTAYMWIGATDQTTEGTWIWDGNNDHVGTTFYQGQGANGSGNGVPVNGLYNNWGGTTTGTNNEPDNYNAAQHFGAIGMAGWPAGSSSLGSESEWNDLMGSSLCYFIVEKDSNLGVTPATNSFDITLSPNPCTTQFTITAKGLKEAMYVELHDVMGRVIISQSFENNLDLHTTELQSGIYSVWVSDGIYVLQTKLVIE